MTKAGRPSCNANSSVAVFQSVGCRKRSAGLRVPGVQLPASCLIESCKTGAFLQEMESLRAADLELYGSYFVQRKGS